MNKLISLEPSNLVPIRIEPGQKCSGQLTLVNVMYTMPVAFRLQPHMKTRYSVKPQSGIIAPLEKLTVEIIYHLAPASALPDTFPYSDDSFLLHSVVVPGAAIKDYSSTHDAVPADWFTARKKQVFTDSAIKIVFVGSPVLSRLVADGSMDEVRDVLEKSDPSWEAADSVDSQGRSLLHLAISRRRADLVQLILEFGPNLEAADGSGYTPLEAACASGDALIVELLLARKAGTERSEGSNYGPVHLATRNGQIEVLRLLLLKEPDLDALTKDGRTALHLAVEERRRDCARLLLASGARVDVGDAGEGNTPLHVAAGMGDEGMVKLLLRNGAVKEIRNRRRRTAYDLAAENGHARLYDALRLGDSLCRASREGDSTEILRLLESGAAVGGRDQRGWTALHRACFKGRVEAVRTLLEKGAEIDGRDEEGYAALHCAAEAGHGEVIELLVKRGADVEARTSKGATALQIAEALSYSGIARILVQSGASKSDFAGGGTEGGQKKRVRGSFARSMPLAVV